MWAPILYDFNPLKCTESCFVAQNMTLVTITNVSEKNILQVVQVECSTNKCQLGQVGWQHGAILLFTHVLSAHATNYWGRRVEISTVIVNLHGSLLALPIFVAGIFERLLWGAHVSRIVMSSWWTEFFDILKCSSSSLVTFIVLSLLWL